MERLKEHFKEVLNRLEPEMHAMLHWKSTRGYITKGEIGKTIKNLANNRATVNEAMTGEV